MQAKTLHCGKEVAEHAWAHRGEPRNRSERSGQTSSQSVAEGVSTRGNANNTRELIDLWAEVQELHAKFRQQHLSCGWLRMRSIKRFSPFSCCHRWTSL